MSGAGPAARNTARLPALAAWLLDPERAAPSADVLRATNLAGYAYVALPPGDPARAVLRADYLAALARHQRIKAELLPLLQAWNAAGIEPLLFKGFYLAEFVYPAPGMRFHGDVDVLVRPQEVEAAGEVARRADWTERYNSARAGRPYFHGACSLYGPDGAACIDLHRWVVHSFSRWNGLQRRVTAAVWAASELRTWEGVLVRVPAPVDALLVGLVLQRGWGDHCHLKNHDAVDFRFLSERLGVTRQALEARARELRTPRTLALFLERCDPPAGRLALRRPARVEERRWSRASVADRGLVATYGPLVRRIPRIPCALASLTRALPSLVAARRAAARHGDLLALLGSLVPPAPRSRGSIERRNQLVVGVLRGARLFPHNRDGDCLLRALALCHALWRQGWPARFVSGVRRSPDLASVRGHAWVELDGDVLAALREPMNRAIFAVNLEYPPPAPPPRAGAAVRTV